MIGIIGARGFIGRSLVDHYNARHNSTVAFVQTRSADDRFKLGALPEIREHRIGAELDPTKFKGINTLILAASATNPRSPGNCKANEMALNVLPHQRFVTALLGTDVKHLIYLSSGGTIYGNPPCQAPLRETQTPNPITAYGYGKRCIEQILQENWAGEERRLTILRPSNPVGLHQRKSTNQHGLLPTVFENILAHRTIRVFGDGSTVRDYFAVEDLCDLVDLIINDRTGGNSILNASSAKGYSINEIIQTASAVLGLPARIHYRWSQSPTIKSNILSNERARRAYGWAPLQSPTEIFQSFQKMELDRLRIQRVING